MNIKTPSIKALSTELARIKREWLEECGEVEVTLACDESGFGLQTGDNSFTGSAYCFQHWGVSSLFSGCNCRDIAIDLIEQCKDLASY